MAGSTILGLFSDFFRSGGVGVAPFGVRYSESVQDAFSPKRYGYFGVIPNKEGAPITELSSAFELDGKVIRHPLVVPTLNAQEISLLQAGGEQTQSIYDRAEAGAMSRIQKGQDPFATTQDVRFPVPEISPMYRDPFADTTR